MQKNLAFYVIIGLLACGFFLTLLPYPTFYAGGYNLSSRDISKINDDSEFEIYEGSSERQTVAAFGKLAWEDCVNVLMPYNKSMRVIDVKSGNQFYVLRIGGTLHADVSPASKSDKSKIESIIGYDQPCQKRPIIIELQPNIWSAASLCGKAQMDSSNRVHYCMHFVGSKAHSTRQPDISHQKAISYAYKHGKALID